MPISHSRHCWFLKCYRPLHAILWNTELLELWQCAKPWPAHGALGTASRLIWGEIYDHRAWHSLRSFKKRRKEVRVRLTAAPAPPAASLCCVLSQVVEKLKRKKTHPLSKDKAIFSRAVHHPSEGRRSLQCHSSETPHSIPNDTDCLQPIHHATLRFDLSSPTLSFPEPSLSSQHWRGQEVPAEHSC